MAIFRAVVGVVMSFTFGVILLWFVLPFLWIIYTSFTQNLDTVGDPYLAALVNYGNMIFYSLAAVVLLVVGYTGFAYATERVPFAA